jgi:lysine-specific permease
VAGHRGEPLPVSPGLRGAGLDLNRLPYRSPFFPYGPIFAFALCMIVTLGQNYRAFSEGKIDWVAVTATYVGIPIFLLIWLGYRLVRKTHFVPYAEMKFPALPEIERTIHP